MKSGTPEVEYWMRLATAGTDVRPVPSSQPTRQPVIAQFFERVWMNIILSAGVMTSRNEGARLPA